MSRLPLLFWPIAAIDALVLAVATGVTLTQPLHDDGGREMALFFFMFLPGVVLAAAIAVFAFCTTPALRLIALFIVAVPGLGFVWLKADDAWHDYRSADRASGAGYFHGSVPRALGVAVVQRDVATLRRLGPGADINAVGEFGMTLLMLAVDRPNAAATPSDSDTVPVVEALLALGARPDTALAAASKRADPALLKRLLDAGGNPNLRVDGQPLVYAWLPVTTPVALRLLAAHGLDLESTWYDDPLTFVAAVHERWDLLAVLVELGADPTRPRPDGRRAVGEVETKLAEARAADHEPAPELLRVAQLIGARSAR